VPNALYNWSGPQNFSSVSPDVFFAVNLEQMGDFSATISINGCVSSPSVIPVFITNIYDYADFEFPNVLTPNGDGNNDELDIEAMFKSCQEFNLKVFNRWGSMVYFGSKSSVPFGGNDSNGGPLGDGVYFYLLEFDEKKKSGFIHLIR
jgi:gliding motility-associated-like protein